MHCYNTISIRARSEKNGRAANCKEEGMTRYNEILKTILDGQFYFDHIFSVITRIDAVYLKYSNECYFTN